MESVVERLNHRTMAIDAADGERLLLSDYPAFADLLDHDDGTVDPSEIRRRVRLANQALTDLETTMKPVFEGVDLDLTAETVESYISAVWPIVERLPNIPDRHARGQIEVKINQRLAALDRMTLDVTGSMGGHFDPRHLKEGAEAATRLIERFATVADVEAAIARYKAKSESQSIVDQAWAVIARAMGFKPEGPFKASDLREAAAKATGMGFENILRYRRFSQEDFDEFTKFSRKLRATRERRGALTRVHGGQWLTQDVSRLRNAIGVLSNKDELHLERVNEFVDFLGIQRNAEPCLVEMVETRAEIDDLNRDVGAAKILGIEFKGVDSDASICEAAIQKWAWLTTRVGTTPAETALMKILIGTDFEKMALILKLLNIVVELESKHKKKHGNEVIDANFARDIESSLEKIDALSLPDRSGALALLPRLQHVVAKIESERRGVADFNEREVLGPQRILARAKASCMAAISRVLSDVPEIDPDRLIVIRDSARAIMASLKAYKSAVFDLNSAAGVYLVKHEESLVLVSSRLASLAMSRAIERRRAAMIAKTESPGVSPLMLLNENNGDGITRSANSSSNPSTDYIPEVTEDSGRVFETPRNFDFDNLLKALEQSIESDMNIPDIDDLHNDGNPNRSDDLSPLVVVDVEPHLLRRSSRGFGIDPQRQRAASTLSERPTLGVAPSSRSRRWMDLVMRGRMKPAEARQA